MADIVLNRLQFVKHEEVFTSREDAINYVLDIQSFERPSLVAEPMILLYESGSAIKGPNVILAIGSVGDGHTSSNGNRTFFIDTQKTEEEIEELRELIEEAIKSLTLVPIDSKTLDLSAEKTDNGTLLSGDVKIADYRIVSGKVNENIIDIEGNKGIYAFADMEYDPETFTITFKTTKVTKEFQLPPDQHVVNGWYSTTDEAIYLKLADNSKVKIDVVRLIDEWTVLSGASSTPICLYKQHVSSSTEAHDGVYDWQDILTADVRVATHIDDNIIDKDATGKYLYVKGTADNIKYKNGQTVADALDNIDTKVSTSEGNLIYKRPDGIYAYAMLGYNTAENKLIYTYSDGATDGNKTVEFQLNSVKIIDDITYDPVKEVIVIRYIDAQGEYQRVEIPAKDIIEEWTINNEAHNVELTKYRSEGQGKDILSADVKIYNGDNNILEDKNHMLYVNGISDNIKYDVTGDTTVKNEIDALKGSAESLNDKIDAETERAEAAEHALDNKIDQEIANRIADVNEEQSRAEAAEQALQAAIDAEETRAIADVDEEEARAEAAEQTLNNKIGTGFTDDPHENVTAKFNELTDKVNSEDDKLQNEIDRSTSADTVHDGRLDAIDAEIGDGFGPRNTVRDEIENLQSEIDAVSADSASSIKDVINNDHSINVDKTDATKPVISVNLSTEVEDEKPNLIKLNADGLYAGVDLIYNFDPENGKNDLIFKTTNSSKTIELKTASVVDKIYYDPSREAIIIEYSVNGHRMPDVVVPIGDLINEWRVEDGHPNAVQLEKVRVASGTTAQDVLKASVVITDSHNDNILVMDDGTLYVSGAQIETNKNNIAAISGDLITEIARAEAAEDALSTAISLEEDRAISAETALNAKINQEIADRIADVNEEQSRAEAAEQALQAAIDAEETRATAAELALSNKIDADVLAEKNRAISAETALDNKITREIDDRIVAVEVEETRAKTAELSLSNKIDSDILAERNRAISAETALQSAIESEAQRATNAEAILRNDFTNALSETATRLSAYTQTAVNEEKTRAISTENVLSGAIVSETERAVNADALLQDTIYDEINRSSGVDAVHDAKIAALESSSSELNSDIIAERTRAISAETALQTAINDEATRALNAENTLNTTLTTKISESATILSAYTQTAVNGEQTRAMTAEGELRTSIVAETERANAADTVLSGNIQTVAASVVAEEARARAAEESIRETIDDNKITFDDTTSIDFSSSTPTVGAGSVITAEVKLHDANDNLIKCGQGLYATARLDYNSGTNKIKLITSAGEQEFQLSAGAIIDNIYYDENTGELVITYHNAEGTKTVRFSVSELFNPWIVQNPSSGSAIELVKTPAAGQGDPDELSGRVLLTNLDDNAIQIVNNGLYVSSSAMSEAEEVAQCAKYELGVFEKAVIGHKIDDECGSGYTYEPNPLTIYINSATSFNSADVILDNSIHKVDLKVDETSAKTMCVDTKANKMYELLFGTGSSIQGCGEDAQYIPDAGSCVISGATSFYEADRMLGDQICEILEMWVSGITCTSISDWVNDGANKKMLIDVRPSHGKYSEMVDDDLYITEMSGDTIEPGSTEFTDTNALRIVCLQDGGGGIIPDVSTPQNGLYLSNIWNCGRYYGPSGQEQADAAQAAADGYNVDYNTDESASATNYNYMNNVRQ